jgi:spoIIIJ-associated protein
MNGKFEAKMNDKRTSLEIIAPSIDEAVARGLADLGLPEDAVDVEILDEGARGLLGLGSRQARVRLTIREETGQSAATGSAAAAAAEQPVAAEERPVWQEGEQEEYILHVARETVEDLLERMKVYAEVTAQWGEPDDARSRTPLLVDVNGDDLSILIGPKAETLNALQYITSLIIGKELGRSVPLALDVEGYRARRSWQIRQLAQRMAEQAVKSGRRQVLEPMPASERRLVHIALRENPDVTTESIGEDPRRKITIIPT